MLIILHIIDIFLDVSRYAGYTDTYSNNVSFIVINPNLSTKLLEVTFAHELFHAVQFSYFNKDEMSDEIWYKNQWFLEGSAVAMEDEFIQITMIIIFN